MSQTSPLNLAQEFLSRYASKAAPTTIAGGEVGAGAGGDAVHRRDDWLR